MGKPLNYRKKFFLGIGVSALILSLPVIWVWFTFAGPGYYAEFNDIKKSLEEMEGVSLIDAWGHEDLTFEHIGAEIEVAEKGLVRFTELSSSSFTSNPKICLEKIGPYHFTYRGNGYIGVNNIETNKPMISEFMGSSIDVGKDGWFAGFFSFQIHSVQDVIQRYDEICEVISQWPIFPKEQNFISRDGVEMWISVKKVK